MSLEPILASPIVGVVALFGCAALILRLGRSLLGLGLAAAEAGAVRGMMRVSVRTGDLTALAERQAAVGAVRRRRTLALLAMGLWAALLVVPPLADVSRPVYALAVLVWFLPRRPIRLTPLPVQPPRGPEAGRHG